MEKDKNKTNDSREALKKSGTFMVSEIPRNDNTEKEPNNSEDLSNSTLRRNTIHQAYSNSKDEGMKKMKDSLIKDKEEEIPAKYLSNPIDFVNYMELQRQKEKMEVKAETFVLRKYENEKSLKFLISKPTPKEELSKSILQGKNKITVARAHDNYLITGDIMGDIKLYSLQDQKLVDTLPCPPKINTKINALDIDDDGDYIFAGFSNGNIAVFELASKNCKLINNTAHSSPLINMKIVDKIDKKHFRIFSSDEDGNVLSYIIKGGILGFSTGKVEKLCEKEKFPIFLIHPIKFKKNEIKYNDFIKDLNRNVILGNLQNIRIYSLLETKITKIFSFEKPDYIKTNTIPDIAVGLGKDPTFNQSSEQEDVKLRLLFVVSWDKVINLFIIPIIENKLASPMITGHYVNDIEIVKIGFLNISTLYLVDKEGNFKLFNTHKFALGEVEIDKALSTPIISKDNNQCELQNIIKLEGNIIKQMTLKDQNGKIIEAYLYSIISNSIKDELIIMTDKKIYNQNIINYEYYFKQFQKDEEKWIELLTLGINIYQGRISAFGNIPLNIFERKKVIGKHLQDFISQYLFMNIGKKEDSNKCKSKSNDANKENSEIERMMDIIIEFCIEIESVNYLLSDILNIFAAKKYKNLFLNKLEPFILCNKLIKFEIQEEVVLGIIEIYEKKNDLNTLDKLLLHINIKSLDVPSVKQKIKSLNMLSPILYIYSNGAEPDYFEPALFIYNKYKSSAEIPDFISYQKLLKTKKLSSIEEIKSSKQYLCHKLFWYIEKTLAGTKYPYFIKYADKEKNLKAIRKMTYWLLSDEILNDLIIFYPKGFIDFFISIFSKESIYDSLDDNSYNDEEKEEAFKFLKKDNKSSYTSDSIEPKELANHLIAEGEKFKNQNPLVYLHICRFIIALPEVIEIDKNKKISALKFLIENYSKLENNISDLAKLKKNIINTLDNLEFTNNDYNDILLTFTSHKFDEIKLFIYRKQKKYKETLKLYLDENTELKDKRNTLFNFINLTLTNLQLKKGKDQEIFKDFKDTVMNNLDKLGKISIDDLQILINTWYSKDKEKVLENLGRNPEIQLKYVEILFRKFLLKLKENEGNLDDDDKKNGKWIDTFLKLHLKLLCQLNKKDKILSYLKQCQYYPRNESIEICTKYEVNDALIYLYKKSGNLQMAFDIYLKLIQNEYDSIYDNLKSDNFKIDVNDLQIEKFNEEFDNIVTFLEENDQKYIEENRMWFDFLDKLYQLDDDFLKKKIKISDKAKNYADMQLITNKIKNLLEKMISYVSIKELFDIVFEKNKNDSLKEFKPILLKLLSSFTTQIYLLNYETKFLANTCIKSQDILHKIICKGDMLKIDNCDVCLRNFEKTLVQREKLIIFRCKHNEHTYCCFKDKDKGNEYAICPICLKEEIGNSVTSGSSNEKLSMSYYNKLSQKKGEKTKKVEKDKKNIEDTKINTFNYNKGFRRMRAFDNSRINKRNLFYYDISKSLREDYQKPEWIVNSSLI